MAGLGTIERETITPADAAALLGALPSALVVVDQEGVVRYVNPAAEQFFQQGASHLQGRPLGQIVPEDSPMLSLVRQVALAGAAVTEYDIRISLPKTGTRLLTIQAAPFGESDDLVVLALHEQTIARKIDQQLVHRHAARSVTAMSAMLAHEVKNPLSGIRGAAQLLEHSVPEEDRSLTRLICDETDRICGLVDRMGVFADNGALERSAVNIHRVLERVRGVAEAGFASHVKFTENYDPSLPPVSGNFDQLVQVFLNLVKNAAEAVPAKGGEIVLSTAYRHGIRIARPGSTERIHLPLVVSVQDNGSGIPEDLANHLFDPFVTTKSAGTGLGLALAAKYIGDHGGVIEFDSQPRRTVFRVMLPVMEDMPAAERGND